MIDVSGTAPDRHTFAPSPLAKLAAMLHALVEPGHHQEIRDWSALAGPDLHARIDESHLLWRSSRADFLLPAQPRDTLGEELDDLDALDDEA